MSKAHAISIVDSLRRKGHKAYLVGGCVRDLLLGREPADYDVATDATPGEVMRIFPETYSVGAQFGVVLVPMPKDEQRDPKLETAEQASAGVPEALSDHSRAGVVEVATFRSDIGYNDG